MTVPGAIPHAIRAAPHAPASPAVRLEGLTKRFPRHRSWQETIRRPFHVDAVTVVDGVTLDVAEGSFFGLLGPNGAGKTTLFKMLSTAATPDGGRAWVLGHDVVRNARDVRQAVGVVMANDRSLYWRLSAVENLRLYGALFNIHGAALRARIVEALRIVGLADAGKKMVGQYSSGMRQRLLIARALLVRPKVLLLDEPTRSLDPVSARTFRRFLREEISGRVGCTVLLATHSGEEAFELCDRVGILDRGRMLATGSVAEIAARVGGDRYAVWTRTPFNPAFEALARQGRIELGLRRDEAEGWTVVEFSMQGTLDHTARILEMLSAAGVSVARFERVPLSLADLIERVVATRTES